MRGEKRYIDPIKKHFNSSLEARFPQISKLLGKELKRQDDGIELIASENYVSQAVLDAAGSVLTNKYAEGYPEKRYYGGCEAVDQVEKLAIELCKELFNVSFANVQPHSGASANTAVQMALLKPGDVIMGMSLAGGGHLTHGAPPTFSGKNYKSVQYGVNEETGLIDYEAIREMALKEKPKLIIAGGSAYSREIDWQKFREITDELNKENPGLNCKLMADIAHPAGLVAAGLYKSPVPYCDVVTFTNHKTLRGIRGGTIITNFPDMIITPAVEADPEKGIKAKKAVTLGATLNSAVFPGIQGGPLMHVIAAKAVGFAEALEPGFKEYMIKVKENAQTLAKTLQSRGLKIVSGGTDSHLMLVDLRSDNEADKPVTGKDFEAVMERAGLTANKNGVPGDKEFAKTSGIRLGTPAATTRGFGKEEFIRIGNWTADLAMAMRRGEDTKPLEESIRKKVEALCDCFPIYENMKSKYHAGGIAA